MPISTTIGTKQKSSFGKDVEMSKVKKRRTDERQNVIKKKSSIELLDYFVLDKKIKCSQRIFTFFFLSPLKGNWPFTRTNLKTFPQGCFLLIFV